MLGAGIASRRLLVSALAPHAEEAGLRIAINSFGQGYLISRPSGGRVVAGDLDGAVDRLGLTPLPVPAGMHTPTDESVAQALVLVSRARRHEAGASTVVLRLEDSLVHLQVTPDGVDVTVDRPSDYAGVTKSGPIVSSM
ncbi:hypothetical protein SRABI76_01440 [Microbacterium oxydans]|nr:hypothetical protein SRABI76_01440 [Microbacterium oxydans]